MVTREQHSTQWDPARLLAGGAVLVIHGILIVLLATSGRFQVTAGGASTPSNSLMYVSIAPAAPRSARSNSDQRGPPIIALPESSAVPRILPLPIIVIPNVEIPLRSWVEEAHLAIVAELAREQAAQRAFTAPSGSDSLRDFDPSTSRGAAAWDAAKPKGLELDMKRDSGSMSIATCLSVSRLRNRIWAPSVAWEAPPRRVIFSRTGVRRGRRSNPFYPQIR